MKQAFYAFLLCIASFLSCEETHPPGFLSSDAAHYDGSHLVLQGHVFISHELGNMQAEKALIDKQEDTKTEPFTFISLERDVLLSLFPASEVRCDKAQLNFKTCKAILASTSDLPITYTDLLTNSKLSPPIAVRLTSKSLELDFREQEGKDHLTKYEPCSLLAKEHVIFSYGPDIHLAADTVVYHKELPSSGIAPPLQGTLIANSKTETPSCVLHYQGQDMISEKITLDFTHSRLYLTHPAGKLPTCLSLTPSPVDFKADALDWDEEKKQISLFGNIHLSEPSFGSLHTQEKIDVSLDRKEALWISKLKTTGPSILTYQDEANGIHEIVASGPIVIDGETKSALIQSVPGKPLSYESDAFFIFANSSKIEYTERAGKCLPSSLFLEGEVRLVSKENGKEQKVGLADGLIYSFSDQSCLLTSLPGKQVLFTEGNGGMRLAAPKVQIFYNSVTKEPQVKGIGVVQFSFTPDEEGKLQHFLTELKKTP